MNVPNILLKAIAHEAEAAGTKKDQRLAIIGMGLCIFLVWMIQHPYFGVIHDSVLYTLLALSRLHPQDLANDIFLKYGSQDSFTIWSPLFAAAIRALDLEPAAALGTLLGQLAFFYGAWVLARRLMPAKDALLALGLLVALPAYYGAMGVFSYIESFLTPRQITEALVLISLAMFLSSRRPLGAACLLMGMLLHPIMAFSGIVMAVMLYGVIPRPRLGLAILAAGLALSLTIVLTTTAGPFKPFDPQWLSVIQEASSFLFLQKWGIEDWIRVVPPVAVLVVGLLTTTRPLVRNLCWGALATAGCGLLLTFIFCDLLAVQLVTEMQPWRWLWLEQAIAIILLPVVMGECWRAGLATRAVSLLLASLWVNRSGGDPQIFSGLALLTVVCAILAHRATLTPRAARLVFIGSCTMLAIALFINLVPKLTDELPTLPNVQMWAADGIPYAIVLLAVHWLAQRRPMPGSSLAIVLAAALGCVYVVPSAWKAWSLCYYRSLYTDAARWRAAVPPQAQVMWPTSPIGAWYLLDRPSYWSRYQEAGDIFSRNKAMEAWRRGELLVAAAEVSYFTPTHASAVPGGALTHTESKPKKGVTWVEPEKFDATGMSRACADPLLQFVVSWRDLGPTPFVPLTPDPARPRNQLHLYRCTDLKK